MIRLASAPPCDCKADNGYWHGDRNNQAASSGVWFVVLMALAIGFLLGFGLHP